MQTKLTLRMDEALIEQAKEWAKQRGVSLSETVASFFAQLPRRAPPTTLSAWTSSLAGAAAVDASHLPDDVVRDEYLDHLESKHG
jgi:hypothetical protein